MDLFGQRVKSHQYNTLNIYELLYMDLTLVILTWYLNHFIFLCPNRGPKPLSVSLIFKEAFHV